MNVRHNDVIPAIRRYMTMRQTGLLLFATFLCGCTSSDTNHSGTDTPIVPESDLAQSGFKSPDADGLITEGLSTSPFNPPVMQMDADGNGYAHSIGAILDGEGFVAYAALLPGNGIADRPTTGSAQYDANYSLYEFTNITETDTGPSADGDSLIDGAITLSVDFDDRTLSGRDGELVVNGVLAGAGNDFGGSVTWGGVEGELQGLISPDNVIGAFHGNSEDAIFAGGFLGEKAETR